MEFATPLQCAAILGDEKMVLLLIRYGADINATNKRGFTALDYGAAMGRMDVVDILLKCGATKKAFRAADMASSSGFNIIANKIRCFSVEGGKSPNQGSETILPSSKILNSGRAMNIDETDGEMNEDGYQENNRVGAKNKNEDLGEDGEKSMEFDMNEFVNLDMCVDMDVGVGVGVVSAPVMDLDVDGLFASVSAEFQYKYPS
ncbi:Ankyrin-1 [Dactylella cylindrospora]|nr:Ankyrin-1 [Dactylella cylindrospora]